MPPTVTIIIVILVSQVLSAYHDCERAQQATAGRADWARWPAQGPRPARAAPALRKHLEPRFTGRVGSPLRAGEGEFMAYCQEARRKRDPNQRSGCRSTARGSGGAAWTGPRKSGNRPARRGRPTPPGCFFKGHAAREVRPSRSHDAWAAAERGLPGDRSLAGNPPRGPGKRYLGPVQRMPAVRLWVLRPLQEPLGSMVRNVSLREPD